MPRKLQYINQWANPAVSDCTAVETDGTYIFAADKAGNLRALTWDGSSYTLVQTLALGQEIDALCFDGTYLHVGCATALVNNLRAYTFDGANFTLAGQIEPPAVINLCSIYYDGTYLYVGGVTNTIFAYSFNGVAYSYLTSVLIGSVVGGICGDGTYLYVVNYTGDNLFALTFDGGSFSNVASINLGNITWDVCVHNGYIIVGTSINGAELSAYSFDGSNFTLVAAYNASAEICGVVSDGTYIFAVSSTGLVYAFSLGAASFTRVSYVNLGSNLSTNASGLRLVGRYLVLLDTYIHTTHSDETVKATRMWLQAEISATPTSGRAPLTVQFYGS